MENYSKMIDSVIKKLDWDIIMKYYENGNFEEIPHKRKRVQITTKSIVAIKKELKDLAQFAIDGNLSEVQHDNWMILWNVNRLEIIFTPVRATSSINDNTAEDDEEINSDIVERDVLKDMLDKSIKEENYELSAVIHSRLKKLEKILSVSLKK